MDHKNVVGREVGRIRSNRGWSQAELARELQKAGWDISRSEVSKIEMRIREVKDWQMMLLVHLLETPHESFYPRLDPKKELRDVFAATMTKRQKQPVAPIAVSATDLASPNRITIHPAPAKGAAAARASHARNNTALPANTLDRSSALEAARNSASGGLAAPPDHWSV